MKKSIYFMMIVCLVLTTCKRNENSDNNEVVVFVIEENSEDVDIELENSNKAVEDNFRIKTASIYLPKAIEYNNKGFEAYEQQDYKLAEECFRLSILFDSTYILPHYNLACVLNILRDNGEDIDIDVIISELIVALNLDPSAAQRTKDWLYSRLRDDPDLYSLHEENVYKSLFYYKVPVGLDNIEEWILDSTWKKETSIVGYYFHDNYEYSEGVSQEGGYSLTGNWKYNKDQSVILLENLFYVPDDLTGDGVDRRRHLPPQTLIFYPYEMRIHEPHEPLEYMEGDFFLVIPDTNIFYQSIEDRNYGNIIQLVKSGFPVNYYDYDNYLFLDCSPLMTAFENDDICMLQLLIGYGVEIYPKMVEKISAKYPELYKLVLMKEENIKGYK